MRRCNGIMAERKNAVHDVESTVYYTHTHSANMHIRVYYNVPFNHSKMWEHIHFYMCISTSKGLNASARTNKKTWKEKKEHHLEAQQPLKCISHIRISHLKAYFLSLPLHSFVHFKRGNEIVFSAHFRIAKGKPKKPIESLFFPWRVVFSTPIKSKLNAVESFLRSAHRAFHVEILLISTFSFLLHLMF